MESTKKELKNSNKSCGCIRKTNETLKDVYRDVNTIKIFFIVTSIMFCVEFAFKALFIILLYGSLAALN